MNEESTINAKKIKWLYNQRATGLGIDKYENSQLDVAKKM